MDIENIKNAGIELQNSQYYFKSKIKYSIIIFVLSLFLQIWIISLYGVGQSYTVHNDVVYDYQNNPVFIPQNGGENFDQTKGLILLGIVNFFTFLLIAINGLVMNFKIFNSFKNAGEYLNELSETIGVKSSVKSTETIKHQKTKNLKGKISKIKDSSGNFFLVVEDRRYYYDSESSVDNSIEHYKQTGNLLEDGLLKP